MNSFILNTFINLFFYQIIINKEPTQPPDHAGINWVHYNMENRHIIEKGKDKRMEGVWDVKKLLEVRNDDLF